IIGLRCAGPVVEPGPRRRPAEPQIVGSNPTRPVSRTSGSKHATSDCHRTFLEQRSGPLCFRINRDPLPVRFKMWKRKIVIIVVVCTLAFVFAVPIQSAESPGAVVNPATGSSCCIHYRRSLSCLFLGIGDNYWDGTLSLGCEPIVV